MNKKMLRRSFLKKNLLILASLVIFKLDLYTSYFKLKKLKKKRNFIWYLNVND